MRFALLAVVLLAACAPEDDAPGITPVNLDGGSTVYIAGIKRFAPEEIAAGVKPSQAILAAAADYCPRARFVSATSTASDPRRVGYFFSCP